MLLVCYYEYKNNIAFRDCAVKDTTTSLSVSTGLPPLEPDLLFLLLSEFCQPQWPHLGSLDRLYRNFAPTSFSSKSLLPPEEKVEDELEKT